MANAVILQQIENHWRHDLFSCCEDVKLSCYGFWCCPCLACSTTKDFGERRYLPIVDFIGPACFLAFGVPMAVPPASLGMRVAMRYKYNIKGSICHDILASCFCVCCSWCQMAREVKERNTCNGTTLQPMVVQMQPAAIPTNIPYMTNPQGNIITTPQYNTLGSGPSGMAGGYNQTMAMNPNATAGMLPMMPQPPPPYSTGMVPDMPNNMNTQPNKY
ncbi:hypothetical protein UPYG_G00118470 [Umbra pygmaea]|uniref:Uncharacterized protein n=1 Tax=Umbra pygmaea TaxID=75934 RepID=A0ABD0X5A0_UMBPY